MTEQTRRLLRRIPLLLVLVALAWLFWGNRPHEVTLVYALPHDPAPTHVEVQIEDEGGQVVAAMSWGSAAAPAEDRQSQKAVLRAGVYRLEATLDFPGGSSSRVSRNLHILREDDRITVYLQ